MVQRHNRFLVFLKDKRKKPFLQMAKESLILLFLKREIPFYYFKFLYRKGVNNFRDYLSTREANRIKLSKNFRKTEYNALSVNKLFFSFFCRQFGVPIPDLVGYNYNNSFYLNNKLYVINTQDSLFTYLEDLFEATGWDAVFIKPMEGEGGVGCKLLHKRELNQLNTSFLEVMLSNSFIFQAVINQHQAINAIHSKCINTLRIDTFKDKEGKIYNVGAYMRIGVGNQVVDNVSLGGFFIGVDLNTGRLHKTGHTIMEHGGIELAAHPDTGFKFMDFEIPYFKELLNLLETYGPFFPDRYLGWDIAISENGPVVIEVNVNPALFGTDLVLGGSLKNPLVRSILAQA